MCIVHEQSAPMNFLYSTGAMLELLLLLALFWHEEFFHLVLILLLHIKHTSDLLASNY